MRCLGAAQEDDLAVWYLIIKKVQERNGNEHITQVAYWNSSG
jgi:hypothetical protein